MKDPNERRPGFKKAKVGWLPEKWRGERLKDNCEGPAQYGACASAIVFDPNKPRYVRITDITNDGRLTSEGRVSIAEEDASGFELSDGDFLFARTGATVGKTYLHKDDGWRYVYAGYLIRFVPDPNKMLGSFLSAFTHTHRYWYWVGTTLHAGAQPNINAHEYGTLLLPVPPTPRTEEDRGDSVDVG